MNLIILYRFKCALNYITNLFKWFQIARGYCKHVYPPPTIHSVGANTLHFPEEGGGPEVSRFSLDLKQANHQLVSL